MKEVTPRATLFTGTALIALWLASWALSGVRLGAWSLAVALGIAGVKVLLVVLVFMEIIVERTSVRVAIVAGASMIAILIAFMVVDVQTRWTPPLEPPASRSLR